MMRRLVPIFFLLLASLQAFCQTALVSPSVNPKADEAFFAKMRERCDSIRRTCGRPTVALVLSGGGMKGAAHVGVLKYLQELDIPIDMIAGNSMGGLVGGLYALGYSPAELDSLIRGMNWNELLTDASSEQYVPFKGKGLRHYTLSASPGQTDLRVPTGYISGKKIENLINNLSVGYHDSLSFDHLPIPFACVASDIVSGKAKYWTSGPLPLAMRSTMSVPGVFTPIYYENMALVDGGFLDNFPVDLARAMGADIVIGVDVTFMTSVDKDEKSIYNPLGVMRRFLTMMGKEGFKRNTAAATIVIRPDVYDFPSMSFSEDATLRLLKLGYDAAAQKGDSLKIIAGKMNGHGQYLSAPKARDISSQNPFPERQKMNLVGLSARVDALEGAAVLVDFDSNISTATSVNLEARLGSTCYLNGHLSYKKHLPFSMNLDGRIGYVTGRLMPEAKNIQNIGFWHHRQAFYLNFLTSRSSYLQLGVKNEHYGVNKWLTGEGVQKPVMNSNLQSAYADMAYTSLDDMYFPSKGIGVGGTYDCYFTGKGVHAVGGHCLAVIPLSRKFAAITSVYARAVMGEHDAWAIDNIAGCGPQGRYLYQQMPFVGIYGAKFLRNYAMSADLSLRAEVYRNLYLTLHGAMLQDSDTFSDFTKDFSGVNYAVALELGFKSKVIPAKVDVHRSKQGWGAYFTLGYDF